jgi:CheY-like chemotaxis protein
MDIQMPVMNGYQAAEAIRAMDREDTKTLPIVAMTADAFAEDAEKAHRAGMNDHIAKPVDISKLRKVLEAYL